MDKKEPLLFARADHAVRSLHNHILSAREILQVVTQHKVQNDLIEKIWLLKIKPVIRSPKVRCQAICKEPTYS
jgi:hypothetical protein